MFFSILAHFSDDNEKNTICEKYNWKICHISQEKLLFFGRITLTNERLKTAFLRFPFPITVLNSPASMTRLMIWSSVREEDTGLLDLAVIKNKSVFIKHMRSNGTGSVFKGKCMWLVSKDCSYRRIDKEIGKSVQAFKSKTVITLGFAFTYRNSISDTYQ